MFELRPESVQLACVNRWKQLRA